MNQSLKSMLALVILLSLGASVLGWTTRGIEGVPASQFWLRLCPIILIPAIVLLIYSEFRPDKYPDLLRRATKRYFERDGLCFAVLGDCQHGNFTWRVLFQNRFERPCQAVISFRPKQGLIRHAGSVLESVQLQIDCPGAAFGLVVVPYPIDPSFAGKKQIFELIAATRFPEGKGKMVRFRDGMAVGKNQKNAIDSAMTAISVLALHPHFTHAAQFTATLPQEADPIAVGAPNQAILWKPGDAIPVE